jgi:hypothetical protein
MAGLIQQQMGAPAPEPQEPQEPAPESMAMEGEEAAEGGDAGEGNPVFQEALTLAYQALYESEAAKDVAKQLKSAPSIAAGMADIAYNITSVIDERTSGKVPDELLVPLAMNVLEEVGEIADAAGLEPQPEDIADALKTMILRFLGEQGVDTTQLQQAMDQVDPSVFRKAAEGEKVPA